MKNMIRNHAQVSDDKYDDSWNFPYNVAAAEYVGGKIYGYQSARNYGKVRADFFIIDYNKDPNKLEDVLTGVMRVWRLSYGVQLFKQHYVRHCI